MSYSHERKHKGRHFWWPYGPFRKVSLRSENIILSWSHIYRLAQIVFTRKCDFTKSTLPGNWNISRKWTLHMNIPVCSRLFRNKTMGQLTAVGRDPSTERIHMFCWNFNRNYSAISECQYWITTLMEWVEFPSGTDTLPNSPRDPFNSYYRISRAHKAVVS